MKPDRLVWLAIWTLGVSATVTQLVLLREALGAFAGNELVLGIVLGNWFLLTGVGTWLGRYAARVEQPVKFLAGSLILVAVLPLMQVVALRLFRDVVFTRGALVGVTETTLATLVLLAPFGLVSGAMLTVACRLAAVARVYVADSLGSVAGGILFSFGLVFVFDHIGALGVPAALSLTMALVFAAWLRARVLMVVAGIVLAALPTTFRWDALTTARQQPGQRVIFRGNSPYGRLVVTESAGQRNFIENGVPLFSTHNVAQIEETVHYALAQRPDARRVLLIGGGVTGTAREVGRYPHAAVTYVELDPLILKAAPVEDARVRVVNADGRRFVKQVERASRPFGSDGNGRDARSTTFDVVIVDVPGPATLQLNRYFTREFFAEAKQALAPGGVLAFALGRYENYVSPELGRLLATADATVRTAFRQTLLIPGGRVFFLASDGELTADIAPRLPAGTQWVNRHYLDAMLTPDRLADLRRAASVPAKVNEDFEPVLFQHYLRHWLSEFPVRFGLLEGVLVLALVIYLVRLRGPGLVVFAGGFAASALEVVLLLAFQVLSGSVYRGLGLIVTLFMAGLAAGAWWGGRHGRSLAGLALAVAALAALMPALVRLPGEIPVLTFVLAGLVGMQFPVACRLGLADMATTASRLYTADFVGACLGALLASTLLIPVLGVAATCWLTAGLNVLAALAWRWRR